jgi:TPR repeat protein
VYQQAAKLGSAQAQVRLAGMYWMGQGVKKDYSQAAVYYRQAAEQGEVTAIRKLVYLLENGVGTARNVDESKKWAAKLEQLGGSN